MTKKYQNKYRIASTRLRTWDYGSNAAYFVTICTKDRKHYFGEINDDKMNLSNIGKMAEKYWHEIPQHFPFVKLNAFVVMPNHIHGILIIDKPVGVVETQNIASLRVQKNAPVSKNKFGPQSQNLASIIRGYKIGVTKNARKIIASYQWQPRYHDHIIRDGKSFERIHNYILNNTRNWNDDKFRSVDNQ